ncbi:hypothetical protein L1987_53182 [Smallanthus sonchifolius]|uniref:Uncharacterized protein n=1 Tax=Smallanthus sonchifolius TaxID=185202 RepID=A0ACB9EVM3_9ASTR|nr:hypothetical protein L1987_53182 [Smallanthus sonchifolius]
MKIAATIGCSPSHSTRTIDSVRLMLHGSPYWWFWTATMYPSLSLARTRAPPIKAANRGIRFICFGGVYSIEVANKGTRFIRLFLGVGRYKIHMFLGLSQSVCFSHCTEVQDTSVSRSRIWVGPSVSTIEPRS